MSDPYFGYIATAYGVTFATIAWLVLRAWWIGRARARRLRELSDPEHGDG